MLNRDLTMLNLHDLVKVADLMIVSGKPDQVSGDSRNIEIVFRDGIGYDSKVLPDRVKGLVGRP